MPNQLTTSEGVTLTRDTFITHYVAAWLAAMAVHDLCDESIPLGDHRKVEHPPIEDALTCAQFAWAELERINP